MELDGEKYYIILCKFRDLARSVGVLRGFKLYDERLRSDFLIISHKICIYYLVIFFKNYFNIKNRKYKLRTSHQYECELTRYYNTKKPNHMTFVPLSFDYYIKNDSSRSATETLGGFMTFEQV